MSFTRPSLAALAAALALALVAAAHAQDAAVTRPRPRQHTRAGVEDLVHQLQQIRRTRGTVRRILRDRRASQTVKQQATELDALLDRREQIIDRLQQRQASFAAQHQAEIDELAQLNERAREIDERLATARKDVLDGAKDDVAALLEASLRAADLTDALRAQYMQERRPHRRRTAPTPAGQ